jgi:HEAT repeat protein
MPNKHGSKAFTKILADLADEKYPPRKQDLRALSDLNAKQTAAFVEAWPKIPPARRLAIMTELGELAEETFDLDIRAVARAALGDPDGEVRASAIRNLWEDEGVDLIDIFTAVLNRDPAPEARAAAATALGQYVFLGQMEELDPALARKVEDLLLAIYAGPDLLDIRRRALESIGFADRPDAAAAIQQAYESGDEQLRVSALFAMGRSLDHEKWGATVLGDLAHLSPRIRFEAARAAGELALAGAVPALGQLIRDVDPEVREISVWALGEIGGDDARELLQNLLQDTDDDELAEIIDDALANTDLMGGIAGFSLLDLDDDEDDARARNARLN